MAGITKI